MDSNTVANDVITEMDVFESAKVKNTTPSSGSSDSEREFSWNHVDIDDKKVVKQEEVKLETKQEEVKQEETKQEEVKKEEKQEEVKKEEVQKEAASADETDDDMPPLVSEDDSDDSDDDMPSLVSDRADQIMMAIFPKPDCERCEAAMKVLMGHVGNSPESSEIELSEHSDDEEDDDEEDEEKDTGVPTIIGALFIIYLILQIADLIHRLSGRSSIQYCRPL